MWGCLNLQSLNSAIRLIFFLDKRLGYVVYVPKIDNVDFSNAHRAFWCHAP